MNLFEEGLSKKRDRRLLKLSLDNNGCGAVSVNLQASGQEAHSSLKGAMRAKGAKRGQKGPKEYRGTRIFQKGQKGQKGPKGAKRAKRGQRASRKAGSDARQGHLGVGFPEL